MSVFRRHRDHAGDEGQGRRRGRSRRDGPGTGTGADAQERVIVEALADLRDTVVREVMTPGWTSWPSPSP